MEEEKQWLLEDAILLQLQTDSWEKTLSQLIKEGDKSWLISYREGIKSKANLLREILKDAAKELIEQWGEKCR